MYLSPEKVEVDLRSSEMVARSRKEEHPEGGDWGAGRDRKKKRETRVGHKRDGNDDGSIRGGWVAR